MTVDRTETRGRLDRHGYKMCRKTARGRRMEKIGIRQENVGGEKFRTPGPEIRPSFSTTISSSSSSSSMGLGCGMSVYGPTAVVLLYSMSGHCASWKTWAIRNDFRFPGWRSQT